MKNFWSILQGSSDNRADEKDEILSAKKTDD